MKIWHISDTHGLQNLLHLPKGIDLVIHSGDFSNYYDLYRNRVEAMDFLDWYAKIPIVYKVLISGNHDAMAYCNGSEFRKLCEDHGIIYLENESVNVLGFNIWGSPFTPTFGSWYFMKDREKFKDFYEMVPLDTDIMVTHGPPKGILDQGFSNGSRTINCGCDYLKESIFSSIKPKLSLFGHIHNNKKLKNSRVFKHPSIGTLFSNASIMVDWEYGKISGNGNVIDIF
jgi:Icc-related predicted phosphoesterase